MNRKSRPMNRETIQECNLDNRILNEVAKDTERLGNALFQEAELASKDPKFQLDDRVAKRAEKQFKREAAAYSRRTRHVVLKSCAASVAVLVFAFTLCFSTISAFREATIGFFIMLREGNAVINDPNEINVNWEEFCNPTYLPKEFILVDANTPRGDEQQIKYVTLQNGNAVFTIIRQNIKTRGEHDYENLDSYEEIMIGDGIGYFTQKEDVFSIYWSLGEYLFSVSGNLEREEIIKVAEGIQLY